MSSEEGRGKEESQKPTAPRAFLLLVSPGLWFHSLTVRSGSIILFFQITPNTHNKNHGTTSKKFVERRRSNQRRREDRTTTDCVTLPCGYQQISSKASNEKSEINMEFIAHVGNCSSDHLLLYGYPQHNDGCFDRYSSLVVVDPQSLVILYWETFHRSRFFLFHSTSHEID